MISRRSMLRGSVAVSSLAALRRWSFGEESAASARSLEEFGYDQVSVRGIIPTAQRRNVTAVLMGLDLDSLVQPFLQMAGKPAPGKSLGGWYEWKAGFDFHHDDAGFAPAHCFGQWMSALARLSSSAETGEPAMAERVHRMGEMLAATISSDYFEKTRFPCYSFDKLVGGLTDAHQLVGDRTAFQTLDTVLSCAGKTLPGHSIDRERQWKMGADPSWMWDESYTMPENLFLASTAGANLRYRKMAEAYLADDSLFEPLSRWANVLSDQHAYSYTNALCSAMQAYFVTGSRMHLEAAQNGFDMIDVQSFVTGGWGPDELLRKPGYNDLAKSLTNTHNSFETPCGCYAHMKLTRYLLRATRDGRYGDSMERIMWNTVMGVLPLLPDGHAFYYADYNVAAKRIYSVHRWPCCSGTFPQVVADYGINGYLHEPGAVWVNLYQDSELRWTEGGQKVGLVQMGDYPDGERVQLRLSAASPVRFTMHLRIPAWTGGDATLRVNGTPEALDVRRGFASIDRVWRTGDTVELMLPMKLRLECLPSNGGAMQLSSIALLHGPLVLFALREPQDVGPLEIDSEALLKAERTAQREWTVRMPNGSSRRLVPFTEIGVREYSTYVKAV